MLTLSWRNTNPVLRLPIVVLAIACTDSRPTAPRLSPETPNMTITGVPSTASVGAVLSGIQVQIPAADLANFKVVANFVITRGGGSIWAPAVQPLQPNNQSTSPYIASNQWTLGPTAGVQSLEVRLVDANNQHLLREASVDVNTTPLPATLLNIRAGNNQTAPVTTKVLVPPSVQVTDVNGNGINNVCVTFAITAGSGTVTPAAQSCGATSSISTGVVTSRLCLDSPSTCAQFVDGVATLGGWNLGRLLGTNGLQASFANQTTGAPTNQQFTATGGVGDVGTIAVIGGSGQTAEVGTSVAIAPSVAVTDVGGNRAPGKTVKFFVASGGGRVANATVISDSNGVATVGAWTLGTGAGPNSLTATAQSSTTTLSVTLVATGIAGPPSSISAVSGLNQSATVNSQVSARPTVQVADRYGNPVAQAPVTFLVQSGGGSIVGSTPTTGSDGRAAVGSWTLGTKVGTNALSAGIPGSLSEVSFTATGTAASVSTVAKSAGDAQTGSINAALPVSPTILATDAFGNPVPGAVATFTVASGGGSPANRTTTTATDGTASFGTWTLGPNAGTNTLNATVNGITTTFTATATGPVGLNITNSAGDAQQQIAGTTLSIRPAVLVTDQSGNPVGGVAVTFAVTAGGGSITGATALTNAQGIATVGSWTLGTAPGINELQASFNTGASRGYTIFVATGS